MKIHLQLPVMNWHLKQTVLAESDKIIVIEGNHYFPPQSVKRAYLEESEINRMSMEGFDNS
jgi:uncharacterized protein (DUF427 family)